MRVYIYLCLILYIYIRHMLQLLHNIEYTNEATVPIVIYERKNEHQRTAEVAFWNEEI